MRFRDAIFWGLIASLIAVAGAHGQEIKMKDRGIMTEATSITVLNPEPVGKSWFYAGYVFGDTCWVGGYEPIEYVADTPMGVLVKYLGRETRRGCLPGIIFLVPKERWERMKKEQHMKEVVLEILARQK